VASRGAADFRAVRASVLIDPARRSARLGRWKLELSVATASASPGGEPASWSRAAHEQYLRATAHQEGPCTLKDKISESLDEVLEDILACDPSS